MTYGLFDFATRTSSLSNLAYVYPLCNFKSDSPVFLSAR